jgi:hypothetical protein
VLHGLCPLDTETKRRGFRGSLLNSILSHFKSKINLSRSFITREFVRLTGFRPFCTISRTIIVYNADRCVGLLLASNKLAAAEEPQKSCRQGPEPVCPWLQTNARSACSVVALMTRRVDCWFRPYWERERERWRLSTSGRAAFCFILIRLSRQYRASCCRKHRSLARTFADRRTSKLVD